MGGEYDTWLDKRKLNNEGTESIKHCTATAEWYDVSNVEWRRESISWDTEKKQGVIRRGEGEKEDLLLQSKETLVTG